MTSHVILTNTAVTDHPATMPSPIATARGLSKTYGKNSGLVRALDNVDVDLASGQFTAIMGPSGSGKSTLMHCLAGLDTPTDGTITLGEHTITGLKNRALTKLRRERIGFIFQSFNLIPTLTARENITLPLDIARRPLDRELFDRVVRTVGLSDRLSHRPAELSGGQQQRVACARALVAKPDVIFADEPTGNLDSASGREVLSFLRSSVDELGQSVVMVTHDPVAASYAHRVLFLADGKIVHELDAPTPESVLAVMSRIAAPAGANDAHASDEPAVEVTGAGAGA